MKNRVVSRWSSVACSSIAGLLFFCILNREDDSLWFGVEWRICSITNVVVAAGILIIVAVDFLQAYRDPHDRKPEVGGFHELQKFADKRRTWTVSRICVLVEDLHVVRNRAKLVRGLMPAAVHFVLMVETRKPNEEEARWFSLEWNRCASPFAFQHVLLRRRPDNEFSLGLTGQMMLSHFIQAIVSPCRKQMCSYHLFQGNCQHFVTRILHAMTQHGCLDVASVNKLVQKVDRSLVKPSFWGEVLRAAMSCAVLLFVLYAFQAMNRPLRFKPHAAGGLSVNGHLEPMAICSSAETFRIHCRLFARPITISNSSSSAARPLISFNMGDYSISEHTFINLTELTPSSFYTAARGRTVCIFPIDYAVKYDVSMVSIFVVALFVITVGIDLAPYIVLQRFVSFPRLEAAVFYTVRFGLGVVCHLWLFPNVFRSSEVSVLPCMAFPLCCRGAYLVVTTAVVAIMRMLLMALVPARMFAPVVLSQ